MNASLNVEAGGHRGVMAPASRTWTPEHEARCVRIYALLRRGLITRFECDDAIRDIEKDGGLR